MTIKPISLAALVLSSLAACASAYANPIPLTPNGVSVSLVGDTVTPVNTGTVSSTGTQTVVTATYTASVSEIVFHDSNNVNCANCLDFEWVFSNIGPGTQGPPGDALNSSATGNSTFLGFLNYTPEVGYIAGSGVAPTNVNESAVGTITFDGYLGGVPSGSNSDTLVIETDATNDRLGFITVSDSLSANFSGYVPTAAPPATPEPSSLILLGTGILGVAGAARRKYIKR